MVDLSVEISFDIGKKPSGLPACLPACLSRGVAWRNAQNCRLAETLLSR